MRSLEQRQLVVVGVPIDSDGRGLGTATPPSGTEIAPRILRELGVVDALAARDDGDLDVRIVGDRRDPETGILAYESVLATCRGVRDGLAPLLAAGDAFPVVLGGCCAMVPGIAAALGLAGEGPVGLAYVDGHLDLYDGRNSPLGEAADMPVALCLGHGDPVIGGLGTACPLVQARHVALLAHRDTEEARADGSDLPDELGIDLSTDCAAVQRDPAAAGAAAAAALADRAGRFWLSIDVDVLSTAAFPATPAQQPGGLPHDELVALCRPLAAHPDCVGMDVKCYDPGMDDEARTGGRATVELLRAILAD